MSNKIKLQKLQLMRNISDTDFYNSYRKLVVGHENLEEDEKFLLLKLAVIFINEGERELEKLGYRIILMYSNSFRDYRPLYDIAINKNYVPVAKFIEQKFFDSEKITNKFHGLLMFAFKENYRHTRNGKVIYFSEGQKIISEFSKNESNYVIVAPTSYGKSELIISKTADNLDKNVCILVPTKSLLAQTRRSLISNDQIRDSGNKIVTHPDMLNNISKKFIAVLTQERLLRLLQKHQALKFEIVLIDEAHNMLEDDSREILVIQDLKILKHRNPETRFYFFTPFLVNPENLKIFSDSDELKTGKIDEFIKVDKYHTIDLNASDKKLKIYDQFLNNFFDIKSYKGSVSEFDFVKEHAASKNIIYLNRPKQIEEFVSSIDNSVESNQEIRKVQKALKDFLHEDYNLIRALEKGVVYHHGGMPENVRMYVENAFSNVDRIKYIGTSSTLLQGVNIPGEKMFLLTTAIGRGGLNASQFKNLSGRICRFSEVFDKNKGNLKMLEPEVYLIKGRFAPSRTNMEQLLMNRVKDNKIISDDVKNPLIKNNLADLTEEEKEVVKNSEEYQENIESGTSDLENLRIVKTDIARACFRNNIHDFDIFENEQQLEENYLNSKDATPVSNPDNLIFLIAKIFLWKIKLKEKDIDNFKRLENDRAKRFYSMFLEWRASGKSYNEMISSFKWYWNSKKEDSYIYVGTKWGEETSPYKEGFREMYIDLSKKSEGEKTNIAIIRVQEEQNYVDYKLMPYVEILNDVKLVEENFYNRIKYGTDDQEMISMIKEGFSIELAKTIKNGNYGDYISFNVENIEVKAGIKDKMKENGENEILVFEIQYYING